MTLGLPILFVPIVVRGVIYGRGRNGSLAALDARTGKELWIRENMNGMTSRGMNYWESAGGRDQRLIFAMNSMLQELDAKTGKPIVTFGVDGVVDLRIGLDGRDITPLRPDQRAHAGIGWVPQERNIFKSLTVEENLTAVARPGPWTVERIYELFPRLSERRRNLGNQLSGGEQQMLAVGRALILNPRLMLLDEPLEGLAPILVEELLLALRRIIRDEGMSAILVEQNAQKVLGVTDRVAIIERGAVVYEGASADLAADRAVLESYLGVTAAGSRRKGRR